MTIVVRPFEAADVKDWTRCRALAFLATAYFDDVVQSKPVYETPVAELVAFDGAELVGLIDLTFDGTTATIETIAVHPDHQGRGIATTLLSNALEAVPTGAPVAAWTRDDFAANAWYQGRGFSEAYRYLHVYAKEEEMSLAVAATHDGLVPVAGFFHANLVAESHLRAQFSRVHVCRQYLLSGSTRIVR